MTLKTNNNNNNEHFGHFMLKNKFKITLTQLLKSTSEKCKNDIKTKNNKYFRHSMIKSIILNFYHLILQFFVFKNGIIIF